MKNFIISLGVLLINYLTVAAQQLVSISPNIGQQGQLLTTLITGQSVQFQSSSPNGNILGVELQKAGYDSIVSDTSTIIIIDNSHFNIDISIPSLATQGLYNLVVKIAPLGTNLMLANAFRVGTPDGTISGTVYYDTNGNGVKDGGEPGLANEKLFITPDNSYVYSDASGNYAFDTYNGSRAVEWQVTNQHYYLLSSANVSYSVVINNNNSSGNDFGLKSPITTIAPNQANIAQTLTTTITGQNIFLENSTPAGNLLDVHFNMPGLFTLNTNISGYNVLDSNNAEITFTVVGNTPIGVYDLYVKLTSLVFPFNIITYILPSSFTIGPPDGYVSGTVYFDADTNGVRDPDEFGVPYTHMLVTPENANVYPDMSGDYSYGLVNGSHDIAITSLGEFMLSSGNSSYNFTISNNNATGLDFGIHSHLYSISPAQSYQGQSLSTTITGVGVVFEASTPSGYIYDMHLNKSGGGLSINVPIPGITVTDSTHFDALITVPLNADTGYYDVTVMVNDPINYLIHHTYILPHGFHIIMADAIVTGTVYFDADSNKVFNAGDAPLASERLLLTPDNIYAFTDSAGHYVLGMNNGIHSVAWNPLPSGYMTLFSDSASFSFIVNNNTISGLDFGLRSSYGNYNSEIIITNDHPRCNQTINYYVNYRNISNQPTHGTVEIIKSSAMIFISATPSPDAIVGDTLIWNYSALLPFVNTDINLRFHIPSQGNSIYTQTIINAEDVGNTVQFSDTSISNPTITCAFDPNEKTVIPEGAQNQHYTLFGDNLDYTIRFQNTGTDTAFTVTIVDTLSTSLDLNTFEVIASSHTVQTELKPNGVVTFTFNNIILPDSNINEPASHGFVRYIIRAQQGLPANTVVNNTADIFFDQNVPVETNSTTNTMVYVIPSGIYQIPAENSSVTIYPNPFDKEAIMKFDNPANELYTLSISNVIGQKMRQVTTNSGQILIRKQSLLPGVYFYSLKNSFGNNSFTGKFVIW